MKLRNTILFSIMAMIGLASCEMKEELLGGNSTDSGETGLLSLGVGINTLVNEVQTRAAADGTADISADGYIIQVLNSDGTEVKSFTYKEEGMEPQEIAAGSYTLYAHEEGTCPAQGSSPFYGGKKDVTIRKGLTTEASVTCTMENTLIQLTYSEDFLKTFQSWTVSITAGSGDGNSIVFTKEHGETPDPIYVKIADNVEVIKVVVTGTTKEGDQISDYRNLYKPEDCDSKYWIGNDALNIKLTPGSNERPSNPNEPVTPDDPEEPTDPDPEEPTDPDPEEPENPDNDNNVINGIEIEVDGIFGDAADKETISVPTTPGEETPETGDENEEEEDNGNTGNENGGEEMTEGPTLSGNKVYSKTITYTLNGTDEFPEVEIEMKAPAGLKSFEVKIDSDNEDFKNTVGDMGLVSGIDLVSKGDDFAALFPPPGEDDKDYTFKLTKTLGRMLAIYIGQHTFTFTVTDNNDEKANGTLVVNIVSSK
ncbi:hypothetical protein B5F77_01095 [Parabacteroides sp. An277]|uniref:DUF4493 domain-containing protein n=1 Tax=Parabacteroides sp. An277 TaxID=1965619 RepID=UPI000B38D62A|nr:DUF4493 domain-containing protein [Parabacteroides sp. An277]OUO55481.1 hypothetical protein B5F77_01095 [Parabacteroides sp. An277]